MELAHRDHPRDPSTRRKHPALQVEPAFGFSEGVFGPCADKRGADAEATIRSSMGGIQIFMVSFYGRILSRDAVEADEEGAFDPGTIADERRKVLRSINLRRGQPDSSSCFYCQKAGLLVPFRTS